MQRKCPTCRRVIDDAAAAATRRGPRSGSARSKMGGWLDGAYRIASPIREDDLDHGVPAMDDDGNELGRRQ